MRHGIFQRGHELIGKTIVTAGEHLTGTEMAAALTRALGTGGGNADRSATLAFPAGAPTCSVRPTSSRGARRTSPPWATRTKHRHGGGPEMRASTSTSQGRHQQHGLVRTPMDSLARGQFHDRRAWPAGLTGGGAAWASQLPSRRSTSDPTAAVSGATGQFAGGRSFLTNAYFFT